MADLKKEFSYFLSHQEELAKEYKGKVLVIVGENVVGAYDTALEAYESVKEAYEAGSYLIQECNDGKDAYTQTFHSRVAFV